MPPRSPLAARHGLSAAWVRTPDRDPLQPARWLTMSAWLREKLPDQVDVDRMLADTRFVYDDGRPVLPDDDYRPHTFVWFHRDLREEVEVPGELTILHRDERLVVVDKPPFLSTIPRGRHVRQSVVVRLRDELGLPELSPLHRLDRVTSGVLMLATQRRWRGPYQVLFEQQRVRKTYLALAPRRDDLALPVTVRNHIRKTRGVLQAQVVPHAQVNAETLVEVETSVGDLAVYRLTPHTGRTHQLRLHLHDLGIPIVGDPLYPDVQEVSIDDFSSPLQLLASTVEFVDPVDAVERRFVSARRLPLPA
ncbi:pseudouridine synthase [Janibacter cremeus]|uniref:RNA pseudouridylate synthase n=1 Tax=Janibacter cremeus TaxID=1285192 RepID=A0A852VQI5_9MICO|nr:tRNA pseudouridine32 synthase/23S rRNA pseudouridine746 synthase [Janibacter cremeus]